MICLQCKKEIFPPKQKYCTSKCQTLSKGKGMSNKDMLKARVRRERVKWLYDRYVNKLISFKTFCNEIKRIV